MSRENSQMSLQEIYEAFESDFQRTPQKKKFLPFLTSTVKPHQRTANKDDDEDMQQRNAALLSTARDDSDRSVDTEDVDDQKSPYDIEFDLLGNTLYETLQICFTKTLSPSTLSKVNVNSSSNSNNNNSHHNVIESTPSSNGLQESSRTVSDTNGVEDSYSSALKHEDCYQYDDRQHRVNPDKENLHPFSAERRSPDSQKKQQQQQSLQVVKDFGKISMVSPYDQFVVNENIPLTQLSSESPLKNVNDIERVVAGFAQDELIVEQSVEEEDRKVLQERVDLGERNVNMINNNNNNNSIALNEMNNNYVNSFSTYSNNYQSILSSSTTMASNVNKYNNSSLSSKKVRTPLRDITSASAAISSSKKQYHGIKRMLEFSSPAMLVNRWELVSQKKPQQSQSFAAVAAANSSNTKPIPAILYR